MKASTLFALTIAVLIGLGVAVAAKMSGLFAPPAVQAPPPKQPPVKVLAAATNIFSGNMLQPASVYVRDLKPEELEHYQQNKSKYLTPDQVLTQDDLEKMAKPAPLPDRLLPTMRAVSVSVPKDNSAGGLIQVGEWVDVLLTSRIKDGNGKPATKTVTLAPRVRVVAKRNTLWPVFTPLPEKLPIQYTLEVNPYRAALMEFVKFRGEITLTPLSGAAQKELEAKRLALLKEDGPIKTVHFLGDSGPDAEREDSLVQRVNNGELAVGDSDLIALFGLKVATEEPPTDTLMIEQMVGMNHYRPAAFAPSGKRLIPASHGHSGDGTISAAGFHFEMAVPECESCKEKAKNAMKQALKR
jgi:Flp pilus assembly protein CpaB